MPHAQSWQKVTLKRVWVNLRVVVTASLSAWGFSIFQTLGFVQRVRYDVGSQVF